MTAAVEFLELLYGTDAPGVLVISQIEPGRPVRSKFPCAADLGAVTKVATGTNVYFGLGLQPRPPAEGRGKGEDVIAIPALWADIDLAGAAHKAAHLPVDLDAARAHLDTFPVPPSVLVDSGHGLHCYWLFDRPWHLDNGNRGQAQELLTRFEGWLEAHWKTQGWHLDSVSDLARVLRVPGTINRKTGCEPVPVTVLEQWPARRYRPADLEALIPAEQRARQRAAPIADVILHGTQHHTLVSLAGTMRRRGADQNTIYAALREMNKRCETPGTDKAMAQIAAGIARKDPATAHLENSDLGNARRLVADHGADLRYVPEWGKWIIWTGTSWTPDKTGEVDRRAKQVVDGILEQAKATSDTKLFAFAVRSQSASRLHGMVDLATTEPGIPVLVDELDGDPWLLTVANGTLNLQTGKLGPHSRDDLITKATSVAWDATATCPIFDGFLEQILPDPEVREFVQRATGYSLTGDVSEQVLFLEHGTGSNGKSTFKEVQLALLGEHAKPASPKLLLATKHDEHPTAIADLQGRRLVVAHEVEDGLRLDEALVKELTGGDRLKARYMRQDYFDFVPHHKLWLACNHKPRIKGTDHGIWRRIRLIPFEVTIGEQEKDTNMLAKLKKELPGILRWAVDGCLKWHQDGLGTPKAVLDATDRYRIESDLLAQFLEETCVTGVQYQSRSTELYARYKGWCVDNGLDHPLSQKALAKQLADKGFDRSENRAGQSIWLGIEPFDDSKQIAEATL